MILQALAEYYQRKSDSDDHSLAPPGFEKKEIPFLIVINSQGKFIDLEDTRSMQGKKRVGRELTVPQSVKKSSNIEANMLWGSTGYIFGIDTKGKPERLKKQKAAFLEKIQNAFPGPDIDNGIRAIIIFLTKDNSEECFKHPLWEEVLKSNRNLSFRLDSDSMLVCQRPGVREILKNIKSTESEVFQQCLISGEIENIERIHASIHGVWGAQSSGANIVSVNNIENPSFSSYGKNQGFNSPVSKNAAFEYTTALKRLLSKNSRQRIQVGDASTVFWAEKNHEMENLLSDLFGVPEQDNPDKNTDTLRTLFASPRIGVAPLEQDSTRFYVLGLAPNAARISIRFWHVSTVGELATHIRQYFDDIRIVHSKMDEEFPPLFKLLVSIASQSKSENIPPNIAGAFFKSILEGTPFPKTLFDSAIRRIRAEHDITHSRAAIIKACLVRNALFYQSREKEVDVSLDETNPNIGYRLGRLFAVLEKTQEEASPGLNATIRDRFYGAASSVPVTVFPHLLKLKNHHMAKLENQGRVINLERTIGQIVESLTDFPAHLEMANQGRFAIGYYHQRQALFTKKESAENKGELK